MSQIDYKRRYHQRLTIALHNKICQITEGSLVLDAGAGDGRFTPCFKEQLVRVDIDFVKLNRVKTNAICADLRYLPFRDQCFDGLYSIQVLGAFLKPELAIKEMMRVSKHGSHYVLTFLRKNSPYRFSGRANGKVRFDVNYIMSLPLEISSIQIVGTPLPTFLETRFNADRFLGNEYLVLATKPRAPDRSTSSVVQSVPS